MYYIIFYIINIERGGEIMKKTKVTKTKLPKVKLVKPEKKVLSNVNAYGGEGCGRTCGMLKW